MSIGKLIKERRTALSLSQDELAEILGYSTRSAISRIELGYAEVPKTKVPLLAKTLGIAPSDLMGWSEDKAALDQLEVIADQTRALDAELQSELLDSYNKLNTAGRKEANKRVAEMTEIPKYTEGE